MADALEESGSAATAGNGCSEAILRVRMTQLEARLRSEMEVLERRLQGHDDLVGRAVKALEYLQSAVLELAQGRTATAGVSRK